MPASDQTAVVLGASIAGLLAARVLADFYGTVKVVERDVLPEQPVTRRGVPQGALPHIAAARGMQIMSDLFPGLPDELVAGGARVWNDGDLSRLSMSFSGHPFQRSGTIPDPQAIVVYYAHRTFLEWSVRRRVLAIPNIEMLDGHDAVRLTSTPGHERVTGIVMAERESGAETHVAADLVVDATGRGSRTPVFLDQLGYGRPREDELKVHVTYAGLPVRMPAGTVREFITLVGPLPTRPRGFAMFAGEGDTYMLAIQTLAGRKVPTDYAGLLDCVADMVSPDVLAVIRRAEPLADVTQYRFPSNRWRRYDQMKRTPGGLIVMGDAFCNFNPLYGQGMSVAAMESLILRDCLQNGDKDLPRRFFHRCAKELRGPWRSAVSSDLSLPQIAGKRSVSVRIGNAYLERVLIATENDRLLVQQFLRVMYLIDPVSRLFRPSTMLRVFRRSPHVNTSGAVAIDPVRTASPNVLSSKRLHPRPVGARRQEDASDA
ncbi:MAG TPA: 2-polyprenyl-6-methoxyphenol hydroxylase-like oxidoreductase [Mycobacterium sp.]|nr:2-polyprenyl-6-methoxyphenol hydroxylase-like oxidoreductase [Mycobacterium sp.]